MADYLLHKDAVVQCVHSPGQARPTVTDPHVKVSRRPIVTQPGPYTVTGCSLPPQSGGPCATATWTSAAQRVKASGIPVLLKNSQAKCIPTGTGLNILQTQSRVRGT